jgi:FkbM family methyltransferase
VILITKLKIFIAKYLLIFISFFKNIDINEFTRKGIKWHTPLNDIVGLSLYLLGSFEKHNIKKVSKYINDETTVIDIGANIGTFTIGLLKRCPEKIEKIISYEPEKNNYNNLKKNIKENNLESKSEVFNKFVGLGNIDKITSNYPLIHTGPKVQNIFHGLKGDYKGVQFSNLNEINFNENKNYFIKIDVDGYEAEVMSVINKKLKFRPTILIEVNKILMDEAEIEYLVEIFEKNNYKFVYFGKKLSSKIIIKDPRQIGLDLIAVPV